MWRFFLFQRKFCCYIVVAGKNCEAILARASAQAVPFFVYFA